MVRLLNVNMKNCFNQTSENVRPHSSNSIENATLDSQSSGDNATPSNGTSPPATYKKEQPPPPSPGSSPIVLALGECRWDSTKQVLIPFYVVLWIVCKSNAHDATLKTEDILSRVPDARTQNHTSFMHQVAQQIISP